MGEFVYTAMWWVLGIGAFVVWVGFWGDWMKKHPNQGVEDVYIVPLLERAKPWTTRHKTTILVAIGAGLVVWAGSGWRPATRFSVGGLTSDERMLLAVGVIMIAVGLMRR